MDSKMVFVLLIAVFVALSGCAQPQTGGTGNNDGAGDGGDLVVGTFTVTRTDDGFSPTPLTIKKGSTVTFVNNSSEPSWPASAMHPTHTVYPGSDIQKCGSDEQGSIFDACKGLENGESFSFTFNEAGEWGYHDHLNSKKFGKIIVVE